MEIEEKELQIRTITSLVQNWDFRNQRLLILELMRASKINTIYDAIIPESSDLNEHDLDIGVCTKEELEISQNKRDFYNWINPCFPEIKSEVTMDILERSYELYRFIKSQSIGSRRYYGNGMDNDSCEIYVFSTGATNKGLAEMRKYRNELEKDIFWVNVLHGHESPKDLFISNGDNSISFYHLMVLMVTEKDPLDLLVLLEMLGFLTSFNLISSICYINDIQNKKHIRVNKESISQRRKEIEDENGLTYYFVGLK